MTISQNVNTHVAELRKEIYE